jgi:hypothetical protein
MKIVWRFMRCNWIRLLFLSTPWICSSPRYWFDHNKLKQLRARVWWSRKLSPTWEENNWCERLHMKRLLVAKRLSRLLWEPLDMGGKCCPHPLINDCLSHLWPDRSDRWRWKVRLVCPRPSEDDQAKLSGDWKLDTLCRKKLGKWS